MSKAMTPEEEANLLKRLVEGAVDMLYRMSLPDGKYEYVSPASVDIFGYEPEIFYEQPSLIKSLMHPDWSNYFNEQWDNLLKGEVPPFYEYQIQHKSGEVRWLHQRNVLVKDGHGNPIAIEGIVTDITVAKQAEQKQTLNLRFLENMERIDRIIRQATDIEQMMSDILQATLKMFESDRAWLLYPCDPAAESWCVPMERTRPEYPGALALGEEIPMLPEAAERFRQALDKDEVITIDARDDCAPKEAYKMFSILAEMHIVVYPRSGKPWLFGIHQCSHYRDWTDKEKKQLREIGYRLGDSLSNLLLQRSLRESEERYKLAQAIGHVGTWDWNPNTGELIWSDETYRILRLSPSEYVPSFELFLDLLHEDDRTRLEQAVEAALSKQQPYNIDCRVIHKDGSESVTNAQGEVSFDEDGKPLRMMGTFQDITERKQAEESIRKLSQAIEQAGESIVITDREGVIEYANPAFARVTGYSVEEAIGQTPRILESGKHDAAFYKEIWDTVTRGNTWHGKMFNRRKDGSFYPAMLTISPIFDQLGDESSYSHFVGIQSDLTSLENMEHQFQQAQKMEAIGTLVGGIAHDFNNMLAGITGNLYLAKEEAQGVPHTVQYLDRVEGIAFRAADMIQQLLTFARKDMVRIKQLPLNPFIKETLKLLRTSVPENIELHLDICSDVLQINGDGTQLHQVLLNLVNNARDALEDVDEPCITIRLEKLHADETFVENHSYFTSGLFAHLSIADNGCGIPKEQVGNLFDPFFTTKEVGKGTGLGLAMVFGAIKTHHGFVEVESSEGKGSTFHIYIPLLQTEEAAFPPAKEKEVVRGHGELILLVDDDTEIIKMGKVVLESLGYRTLTAINGREAVDLFQEHSEEIELCILDLVMPIMGGDEAAQAIRQINPHTKVIFSTGYDRNLRDGMEHEAVLSKPSPIKEMSFLIRQQLDS
jgi:PAS domain S-box-containing protein